MHRQLLCLLICLIFLPRAAYTAPKVLVTLKPIHALVSGVMEDVAPPHLLLSGQESPHTYTLKPSQMRLLEETELLIWLGPTVERFLEKPLTNLGKKVTTLNLLQSSDLTLLNVRTGELWEHHKDEEVIAHNAHSHQQIGESIDGHIWLSPDNAQIIVNMVATTLSQIDSEHAAIYKANADRLIQRLKEFSQTLREQLIPIQNKPYLVFHDAYQYFEKYYGLNAVGAITLSPEVPLSPKRLSEIRQKIKKHKVICVFSEPQFSPPVLATVVEGMAVRQGILDPLGSRITTGTEGYFTLLQTLVTQLTECLSSPSIR